jgi:cystathionine beta-lyase
MENFNLSHILNHLGENRENYFNAVAPPVIQSSNFCFPDVESMRKGLQKEFEEPFYTRGYNPTIAILREKLAALEGSEDALVFSSGSAAMAVAVMSVVKSGDHVVCVQKPYSWTNKLLNKLLVNYGVETTMADGTNTDTFITFCKPNTKLIILESPNSWTMELQDIEAICEFARTKNITTIIDNSYSTPLLQNPVSMGADIVIHSSSKYINGHSDVVSGVLCASKEIVSRIFAKELMTIGSIISPNDAWLMIRGLRTLELRVNRSSESALKVISFLENHPKIEKVFHPFSKHNPQIELAKKQMKTGGGMLSVLLKTEDKQKIESFCNSLKLFLMACSWGGYESLQFPAIALYDSQSYNNPGVPINIVRLYIGLENADDLIQDLKQGLEKI